MALYSSMKSQHVTSSTVTRPEQSLKIINKSCEDKLESNNFTLDKVNIYHCDLNYFGGIYV